MTRKILHIDCNNAFLSWDAAYRLSKGEPTDLRSLISVIGGDEKKRKGIVLCASYPAKKYGVHTGMSLLEAHQKAPDLKVFPPNYSVYVQCSDAMTEILYTYTALVERYSIDECFMDITNCCDDPIDFADTLRKKVQETLGFTVNIGVSSNKLLAKMAAGFQKPDRTHTLYPHEISKKLWPLPTSELFMVGMKTCLKLYRLGFNTIGQIANCSPDLLQQHFKKFGLILWTFANGIDHSSVSNVTPPPKGVGNSMTLPYDVIKKEEGFPFLFSLCESVGKRLRKQNLMAHTLSLDVRTHEFAHVAHQKKLPYPIDTTKELYERIKLLYNQCWDERPLRQMGIRTSDLCPDLTRQCSIFGEKQIILDRCIDQIRDKYGNQQIIRASVLQAQIDSVAQPTHPDYPIIKPNILKG